MIAWIGTDHTTSPYFTYRGNYNIYDHTYIYGVVLNDPTNTINC